MKERMRTEAGLVSVDANGRLAAREAFFVLFDLTAYAWLQRAWGHVGTPRPQEPKNRTLQNLLLRHAQVFQLLPNP